MRVRRLYWLCCVHRLQRHNTHSFPFNVNLNSDVYRILCVVRKHISRTICNLQVQDTKEVRKQGSQYTHSCVRVSLALLWSWFIFVYSKIVLQMMQIQNIACVCVLGADAGMWGGGGVCSVWHITWCPKDIVLFAFYLRAWESVTYLPCVFGVLVDFKLEMFANGVWTTRSASPQRI